MDSRLFGTAAMSATGTALVVAFSDAPLPGAVGGVAKGLALLAMLLTIVLAMRAPAQAARRPPVVRTIIWLVVGLAVAVGGSTLAGVVGLSFHFIVGWCVLCIGAVIISLGSLWWDEAARRGGWVVVAFGIVSCALGLTPYRELGSTIAGLGGGLVLVIVAGMSAYRARW